MTYSKKTFRNLFLIVVSTPLFLSCRTSSNLLNEIYSPDKQIRLIFELQNNTPYYSISFGEETVVEKSALGLELNQPFTNGFKMLSKTENSFDEVWDPVYGEYDKIRDHYNSVEIKLEEKGELKRKLNILFRVYDEGVAFCYAIPGQNDSVWKILNELTEFNFVDESQAYPIYKTEQAYSNVPVNLAQVDSGALLPFTVKLPKGFASLLEANVVDYPRMILNKNQNNSLASELFGTAEVQVPFSTPWRTILIAPNEANLIENGIMVLNLNPPCKIADPSWIKAGKTISNEGQMPLQTDSLKKLVDFAAENGFNYLQLDWGWYGTEIKWEQEWIENFKEFVPNPYKSTDWEENTNANPYTVASGYVPYRWTERWKHLYRIVELDIHELISYAGDRGVGISLYVDAGRTLWNQDLDSLFAEYQNWGLAGLKPSFVKYGTQEATFWNRKMFEKAAEHHLMLCVHDARIPDGTARTYPNLVINEGGGGQEKHHPVIHDVVLPFTRCLAGSFDYTPKLYTMGKSHAHMLAMLVVYYGPAHTIRGGYGPWNGMETLGKGGEELEFVRRVPATWDDTRVIDAKIGEYVFTARKSGKSWYLGGMTGDNEVSKELPMNFLDEGKTYNVTIFSDSKEVTEDGWCPAKKEAKIISSEGKILVKMTKAGGFVAVFDPIK